MIKAIIWGLFVCVLILAFHKGTINEGLFITLLFNCLTLMHRKFFLANMIEKNPGIGLQVLTLQGHFVLPKLYVICWKSRNFPLYNLH